MSVLLDAVSDSLIRMGILSDTVVAETCTSLREGGQPVDGDRLLDELLGRGNLTSYQVQRIREGRGGELQIGNYLILSEIGAGGMGTVFKALHRRMNRVVALKLLKKEIGATKNAISRFQREVQAAARLNHPNAIAAYDADVCEFGHYLVMEYVEGSDLSKVVRRKGPLEVAAAIDAIRQAAEGLAYAHSQGVVHRDVKPANLMRDVNGVIKVADLGLAQIEASAAQVAEQASLTDPGSMAGTVDFMPPEQALDVASVDHRADIYSLGCTLYYVLTGKPMFEHRTVMARLLAHREQAAPSLCAVRAPVPEALNTIFQRMVAKNPADRYQAMAEVVQDLKALQQGSTSARRTWVPTGSTILLVESSRMLTGMVRRYLNDQGADDIHVRNSGTEALQTLEKAPADVVVAGLQLPDMTGVQLAQRIREDMRWASVAIVLLTSDPPQRLLDIVHRLGGVEVLRKPFDSAQLQTAINQAMQTNAIAVSRLANVGDLQVLCVDDSSVARRRIQKVLTDLGFAHFTSVGDGAQAVAALERHKFDLVVTDYNMPHMDGCQLVTHIRHESSQRDVPVILCTTEFDPAKLAAIYQLGVSAVCNKSFDPELVRNILVRLFK